MGRSPIGRLSSLRNRPAKWAASGPGGVSKTTGRAPGPPRDNYAGLGVALRALRNERCAFCQPKEQLAGRRNDAGAWFAPPANQLIDQSALRQSAALGGQLLLLLLWLLSLLTNWQRAPAAAR